MVLSAGAAVCKACVLGPGTACCMDGLHVAPELNPSCLPAAAAAATGAGHAAQAEVQGRTFENEIVEL